MDFFDLIPLSGVAQNIAVAVFALPLISGTTLYACARRQLVGRTWSVGLGTSVAVLLLMWNSLLLLLVASANGWHTF
jgi:hypothetical protein